MSISDMIRKVGETNPLQMNWGQLVWLVSAQQMPEAEQTFGVVTIYPGWRNPLHAHPNCEEVLYVISGECDHKLADEVVHMTPGTVICIPRGTPHWAMCTSAEPLVAIISFSAPDRQTETLESNGSV
ncbi:MAG: hypothetical protein NVS2B12_32950 [Ktedonobacteraceae bacterium]